MAFLGRNYARILYVGRAKTWQGWREQVSPIKRVIADFTTGEVLNRLPDMDVQSYPLYFEDEGIDYTTSDIGGGGAANSDGMWTWNNAIDQAGPNRLFYAPHGGALRHVATLANGNIRYCAAPGLTLVADARTLLSYAPEDQLVAAQDMDLATLPSPKGVTTWSEAYATDKLAIESVGIFIEGEHAGKYAVSFSVLNTEVANAVVISDPFSPGDEITIRQELYQYEPTGGSEYNAGHSGAEFALAYPQSSIMLTTAYVWIAV
ncbi:hypothetical protein BXT89_03150 [Halopseudomonas pachastrellae]|uniref:Uncharacterized protein n=1 Tax=Halopseudomonas pachastrellae TaxID=254161 RepID=A0A1S8DJA4_9GAMM|nr:hypothetical protein [Halopseudomonas pachastrellae]ONM45434.1 hypothetical protein BXT89_03150 [Halopseudomonas pachastrellae]SFL71945.1 hypothetical protein SAMN05216256_101125 [Halopseudomonas pachastrellae]